MIDKRLQAILSVIPECDTLADVGTDHGLLCLLALKLGKAKRVIATDISDKSLSKAVNLLTDEGYGGCADFRCGDGFNVLSKSEADVIVVSGMGGGEIIKMITNATDFGARLVLSPQSDVSKVREKLISSGYYIERDFMVLESGKYYDIISAVKGKGEYSLEEYEFGKDNLNEPSLDFLSWLDKEIQKADNLSQSVTQAQAKEKFLQRADKLRKLKCKLKGEHHV